MPYAISVMRALVQHFDQKIDCVCWDENKRTPFIPTDEPGITFHKRSTFDKQSIIKFIEQRNPTIMYISGRMDRLYLDAVLHFRGKVKIVTGSDAQWEDNNKQKISAFLGQQLYRKYFDYFWVPGQRQYEFARRMGYANNKIIGNLLTADTAVFEGPYQDHSDAKRRYYPHNLVYAGRFAKTKGIDILIDAFVAAKKELNSDWELTLVGSGDEVSSKESFIHVKGFMSGQELAQGSKNWGAFCLPSVKEPWGVVIHEFAMLGMPIVCSDNVGAADGLVINNYNGHIFRSGDRDSLKASLIRLMSASDDTLFEMGRRGYELSKKQSPLIAAYSLMSILS